VRLVLVRCDMRVHKSWRLPLEPCRGASVIFPFQSHPASPLVMDDPNGQYTYLCSAGSRKSIVLYFLDGTPRQHRRDNRYKPDMVSTVKRPGTDDSFHSNRVEGALFCECWSILPNPAVGSPTG
jgi:hypothetical protein